MKIAFIGHKRIPSREGGVEIVVNELATRFAQNGHLVTVYNRRGHHVSGKDIVKQQVGADEGVYKGIRIISVPAIQVKGLAALTSSLFATLHALFCGYNCIHYHAEGPSAMLLLPHLFGIRTVATIHGLDWQRAKWGNFATKYLKLGEKIAAKYADEVIVLSKNMRQYFRDIYNRETVYIPNGIEGTNIRNPDVIQDTWKLEKNSYILYLGRIVPEKGIHYLIDAYQSLSTKKYLVIAGGSSDTNDYMRELQSRAGSNSRILFTGFVQGQMLEELYSNAYVYVLPSDLEGMPISLLEAMSYGNCCIVSDIPECVEVVERHAVVFSRGDVDDLREKLADLIKYPEVVDDYKRDASPFICKKFSWDKIVCETEKLYKK